MSKSKLPPEIEKEFNDLWRDLSGECEADMPITEDYEWGGGKSIKKFISQKLLQKERDTAHECYLECLAVECGEGECAKAIRTKFNLKNEYER